jgi:hypothetical protein
MGENNELRIKVTLSKIQLKTITAVQLKKYPILKVEYVGEVTIVIKCNKK